VFGVALQNEQSLLIPQWAGQKRTFGDTFSLEGSCPDPKKANFSLSEGFGS